MRIGIRILVASIALLSAETIFADGPVLEAIPSRSIEPVVLPAGLAEVGGAGETAPEVLFETRGLVVARPSARDIELASIVRRKGEGGGGDIAAGSLVLIQTFFLDSKCSYPPCGGSPCNALLVLWDENSYNPEGVDVYVNDEKLGTLPGLPPEDLPGINLAPIYPLPPGPCLIRIEDPNTGSSEQAEILVLDSQPFGDVQRMRCQQGELEIGGTCGLIATWTTPGPLPSYLGALVNGEVAAVLDPDTRGLPLVGVPPGTYTVEVVGLLENAEGNYRGCYPSATCTLDCASDACVKPAGVYVAQRTYGRTPEENAVDITWINGEVFYPDGVSATVDGIDVGTLPCDSVEGLCPEAAMLGVLPLGEHTIGIRGECGDPRGPSLADEATIEILAETPHANPVVEGSIQCEYNPGDGTPGAGVLTMAWVNADPSIFIDIYVRLDPNIFYLGTLPGNATGVTIQGMSDPEIEILELQFFRQISGAAYGSDLISCPSEVEPAYFIRGICNGEGSSPQITSAVVLLSYLYLGGAVPPCMEACDADDDGQLAVTDAVRVLNFLFLGGPPPIGWPDINPVCEPISEGMDCETPRADCPLPAAP